MALEVLEDPEMAAIQMEVQMAVGTKWLTISVSFILTHDLSFQGANILLFFLQMNILMANLGATNRMEDTTLEVTIPMAETGAMEVDATVVTALEAEVTVIRTQVVTTGNASMVILMIHTVVTLTKLVLHWTLGKIMMG